MRSLLALPLLVAACAEPTEDDVDDDALRINGDWSNPTQAQIDRAAWLTTPPGMACTATRIAHRWAITAAHCKVRQGGTVTFYDAASGPSGRHAAVVEAIFPPGTPVADCENDDGCDDANGDLADLALLRLQGDDEDMSGPPAVLAWTFPGQVTGWQVGAGAHGGNLDLVGKLRRVQGEIDVDSDSDGEFTTVDDDVDEGDSGGPFYVGGRIVGVLRAEAWSPFDHYAIYTSVPHRLNWILGEIDYFWLGAPARADHMYTGTQIDVILGASHRTCQYACANTSDCEAYNYNNQLDLCSLVADVTNSTTTNATNWYSALKHAGPTGFAGDVVGYVRDDNRNVVVHAKHENGATSDNRIRELSQVNGPPYWQSYDITQAAPAPAAGAKVSAYRRSDNADAVVYRSGDDNAIVQLKRTANGWLWATLPDGAGTPTGSPVGMVRADGVNAVYFNTLSGHVRELSLRSNGEWEAIDLTDETGAPLASGDVSAYRRSDGYTSVLYRTATGAIVELFMRPGDPWGQATLSNTVNGQAPAAASRPHGYVHADGYNALVYRSTDDRLVELWLAGDGWHHFILPSATNPHGDPFAYVRADAKEAVVSRRASGHLMQTLNGSNGWVWSDLSDIGNPNLYNAPTAYLRNDGYNSVVYEDSYLDDVIEVFLRKGMTNWGYGNLSGTE